MMTECVLVDFVCFSWGGRLGLSVPAGVRLRSTYHRVEARPFVAPRTVHSQGLRPAPIFHCVNQLSLCLCQIPVAGLEVPHQSVVKQVHIPNITSLTYTGT